MSTNTGELVRLASSTVAGSWWTLFARFGETVVLHVDLTADEAREAEAVELLDEAERSRLSEFRYPGPRRRFALCRAALRAILGERLGHPNDRLTFVPSDHGKPFCLVGDVPAPISFNVSHSGSHGLIAFAARGRIGVDVEERSSRQYLNALVDTVLTRNEQAEIEGLPRDLRLYSFFRFWTIKEAIIKAVGAGHSLDVSKIETPTSIRGGAKGSIFESPFVPGMRFQVEDVGNDDFAAALAHEILP